MTFKLKDPWNPTGGLDYRDAYEEASTLDVWREHGLKSTFFTRNLTLETDYKIVRAAGMYYHDRNLIKLTPKRFGSISKGSLYVCHDFYMEFVTIHEMVHAALDQPGEYNNGLSLREQINQYKGVARNRVAHGVEFKTLLRSAIAEYFTLPEEQLVGTDSALHDPAPYAMDYLLEPLVLKGKHLYSLPAQFVRK